MAKVQPTNNDPLTGSGPLVVHPGTPLWTQLRQLGSGLLRPVQQRPVHPHAGQHHPSGTGGAAVAPRHHGPKHHRPVHVGDGPARRR